MQTVNLNGCKKYITYNIHEYLVTWARWRLNEFNISITNYVMNKFFYQAKMDYINKPKMDYLVEGVLK